MIRVPAQVVLEVLKCAHCGHVYDARGQYGRCLFSPRTVRRMQEIEELDVGTLRVLADDLRDAMNRPVISWSDHDYLFNFPAERNTLNY